MTTRGFFAYPSKPDDIGRTVQAAIQILRDTFPACQIADWQENDIAGRFIQEPILSNIQDSDFLAADITKLNFNVAYEIGYAIGKAKRVVLTKDYAIQGDDDLIKEVGLFDTLGYRAYANENELSSIMKSIHDTRPIPINQTPINTSSPVYIVMPKNKTPFEVRLIARVKKAKLSFRSFDPDEESRLSLSVAVRNIITSHGIIVTLLPSNRQDCFVHNIRSSCVAGIASALDKQLLVLQFGRDPVPLDFREFATHITSEDDIDSKIADYAPLISEQLQLGVHSKLQQSGPINFLSQLNLGSSAAENEMYDLDDYFVDTEECRRALRGEVQIVTGRKGSGKTALFVHIRNKLRKRKQNVILDLRPEGFQLIKLKDIVLKHLDDGTKEHTVTAFWEYLLYLEICQKVLSKDRESHFNNHQIHEQFRELDSEYKSDELISEGDFAERILKLTERVCNDFQPVLRVESGKIHLSRETLTNIIYKHDLGSLRQRIADYLKAKESVWILFDNIDKGWPPNGVENDDILILRCLTDAMSKLEKYLRGKQIDCHGIAFVRNDIFELLLERTVDRGKTSRVTVDWHDQELLRELLRRRFISSGTVNDSIPFRELWNQCCISHVSGEESSTYFIDRCLMRPRSLIDMINQCKSHALNLGHSKIDVDDVKEGEKLYSADLLWSIGYEIRDVIPKGGDILYHFVGVNSRLTRPELMSILNETSLSSDEQGEMIDLLLWYGVLGIIKDDGEVAYIYSVRYDRKFLNALIARRGEDNQVFYINPAFWVGLEIKT